MNALNLTKGKARLGRWERADRVKVTCEGLGHRRSTAWLARLTGLHLEHTFERRFAPEVRDERGMRGRGEVEYHVRDGLYEAQSLGLERVIFAVQGARLARLSVQEMIEELRVRSASTMGDVRSCVAAAQWKDARLHAFSLESPGERRAASQMIMDAALGRGLRRELPELRGSTNQVQWAEDLRVAGFLTLSEAHIAHRDDPFTQALIEAMAEAFQREVVSKWWIHHRKHLMSWFDIRERFPRITRTAARSYQA